MKLVLRLPAGRYNNRNNCNSKSSNNSNRSVKEEGGFSGVDSVTSPTIQLGNGIRRRRRTPRVKRLDFMSESTSSDQYNGSGSVNYNNKKRRRVIDQGSSVNKKRRIIDQGSSGNDELYGDCDRNVEVNDDENEQEDDEDNGYDNGCDRLFHESSDQKITKKERGHNVDTKRTSFVSGVPLPDRQELELILDKLQRKDTYDVFARPVDPEELPDYYEVIEHPMDFGTIRRRLAGGTYSNLEELENDVDLVCSNAMQYNAAETVYFKQANAIQELARTKFQSFRTDSEHAKVEDKSEQKTKCNSLVKKPEKKSSCTPFQEPAGSDFSSGATPVSVENTCALSKPAEQVGCEKPTSGDGLVNEDSSLTENKPDEAEEQFSEKDAPTKLGKRIVVIDENRRKTYTISSEPVVHTESIFTPFEGETKQLVDVVLHEDHSYARSLARFAAALGPLAWKVASLRIEQALPTGMNFGRGWVGEYEPLPKPLLIPRSRTQKAQATLSPKVTEWRSRNSSVVAASSKPLDPANPPLSRPVSARKPPIVCSDRVKPVPLAMNKQENKLTVNFAKPENILRQIELNSSPPSSGTPHSASPRNPFARDSEMKNRTLPMVSRNGNVDQSAAFKKPEVAREVTNSDWVGRSAKFNSNTEARSGTYSPRGNQNQVTNEPNQMMRVFAEKTQHKLTSSKAPTIDIQQLMVSAPSQRRDDSSAVSTGDPHLGLNDANQMKRMLAEKTDHQPKWQDQPTINTRELMTSVPSPRRSDSSASASDHHLCLSNPSQVPRMLTAKTQQQLKSSNSPTIGTQQLMMSVSYPRRDGSSPAATDHHQGLSNPNQMPRMFAERTQQQLKPSNPPIITGTPQFMMPLSSPRTDDPSAASTAAARAWMSLGAPHVKSVERSDPLRMEMSAASLYNPTEESSQPILHFRGEPPSGGLQFQSLSRFHPQLLGREPHFQNSRQMVYPQRVTADLSQFQMQPPWQGFVQHTTQTNKKRDMLPPDLNITFQSSGSSGILADSQLPDLALQL